MNAAPTSIGLLYDDSAYKETLQLTRPANEAPVGLAECNQTTVVDLTSVTASPRTVAELDQELSQQRVSHGPGRALLAWLLKYHLLQLAPPPDADD